MDFCRLSYLERAQYCVSHSAKYLFHLMEEKKTNLALSADVIKANDLIELANIHGEDICILKTHIDMIDDFHPDLTLELKKLAKKYGFLLFEDRKFADIGHTVKQQYQHGIYRIADWADMVNAHALPGPGIVKGLAEIGKKQERGLILIAEMSSAGHFMDASYREKTLAMAEQFPEFVMGFITQHALSAAPQWINFTPGIQIQTSGDALGQQYISPEKAILEQGTDIIIVGRGITQAEDSIAAAQLYRRQGWSLYQRRVEGG